MTLDGMLKAAVRWAKSTSNRTFAIYPVCIIGFEYALHGRQMAFFPWGLVLVAWGYLQYRLVGQYRSRIGGGGPGFSVPPVRLVTEGPFAFTRNPMYLGHLIFMAGLAVTFYSLAAVVLLAANAVWFHRRVLADERRLEQQFGAEYGAYKARVKRWIPGVL